MNDIGADWQKLQGNLEGNIGWSQGLRGAFATDASVYQEIPQAVAFPKNDRDLETIVGFCRENNRPIIGRGGGTSLSGQAIGSGIIVDFSRFMNRILDIDVEKKLAVVESGIVLDELNAVLLKSGLLFAPDPATASRATIGGMIGNNACGTRSIVFGRTCDSIESLRCLLPDGNWLTTQWLDPQQWRQIQTAGTHDSRLYTELSRIIDRHRPAIAAKIPRLPRMAAGYSLQYFVDETKNRSLSNLIVGSEGTLALASQATLRLNELPKATVLVVISFSSIDEALRSLPVILGSHPSAVELLDDVLINEAVQNASTRDLARVIVPGHSIPQAVLVVEFFGDSPIHAKDRGEKFISASAKAMLGISHALITSAEAQKKVWDVRRLALGLISNIPGKAKGIALIEDACIPIDRLPEYNRFVYELGEQMGLGISTYAHASVGVLHYKVMLDLHEASERKKMRAIAEACFEKCLEVGGVFSGEHGDGIVRGEFLKRQFGTEVYDAFIQVKRLFDPANRFNPGRKIESPPLDGQLRYGKDEAARREYQIKTTNPSSRFRYGDQGDIVGAIEQCNGVGACRQNLKGTMCPSYRATRDERDSTRGRANLLRLAISGQLSPPGLANPDLHDALELCLSCKACKSECPNAVDMARLKSESLQVKWESQGSSRQAQFVGSMPQRIAMSGPFAWAIGWLARISPIRKLLEKRYGIDHRRTLPMPRYASFDRWWKRNAHHGPSTGQPVALFVDTWNRYLEPQIGIAVVELLWSCGYRVQIIRGFDALRTRMSVGLLDEAKKLGGQLFQSLAPFAQQKTPILCVEPSEASALKDDLPDLIGDAELGRRVSACVSLIDDFLAIELANGKIALKKKNSAETRAVLIHPHCHQRALFRAAATQEILAAAGFAASVSDFGCCGMAGSFGYAHYDVSLKIANQRFLPGIKAAQEVNSLCVATGTSCREQARELAEVQVFHWAELITGESLSIKPKT